MCCSGYFPPPPPVSAAAPAPAASEPKVIDYGHGKSGSQTGSLDGDKNSDTKSERSGYGTPSDPFSRDFPPPPRDILPPRDAQGDMYDRSRGFSQERGFVRDFDDRERRPGLVDTGYGGRREESDFRGRDFDDRGFDRMKEYDRGRDDRARDIERDRDREFRRERDRDRNPDYFRDTSRDGKIFIHFLMLS